MSNFSIIHKDLIRLLDLHILPAFWVQLVNNCFYFKYVQLQKLKSTYVDGMLGCVREGRIYTHWDHTAAVTGRLTSTNPNIQAIPKQPVELTGVLDSFIIGQTRAVDCKVRG